MTTAQTAAFRITNPHNQRIVEGAPTRIIAPDGRIAYASWSRADWMLITPGEGQGWVSALPDDMALALAFVK